MEKPSRHDLKKQKKKVQKRKKSMSSAAVTSAKRNAPQLRHEDDDSDSGDELVELNANSKLVPNSDTKTRSHFVSDAKPAEEEATVLRPILGYLEGKETRAPVDVFAWMIAPITVQEFFDDYWEKKPLLIKRKKRNYYKHLFSTDALDDILRKNYLKYTINVDIARYENGVRDTLNPEGRAHSHIVWDFFEQGNSVRILNPQSYHAPLWRVNSSLQEYFSCMVGSNTYLTPPGAQGFAPHFDDIEAFILQAEGSKRWRLYNNASELLPRYSSENFGQADIGQPFMDVLLESGDFLYFPRGVAVTLPDIHSLHVTVSTYQKNSWADFFEMLVPRALEIAVEEDVLFRQGLPVNYLSYMGVGKSDLKDAQRDKFEKHVKKLFAKLVEYAPIDAAADRLGVKFIHDSLPPALTESELKDTAFSKKKSDPRPFVTISTELQIIREGVARLVIEDDNALVYYSLDNSKVPHGEDAQSAEFPLHMAGAIEYLLGTFGKPVLISTIPELEESDQLELAESLYDLGLFHATSNDESEPEDDDADK